MMILYPLKEDRRRTNNTDGVGQISPICKGERSVELDREAEALVHRFRAREVQCIHGMAAGVLRGLSRP